MPYRILTAEVAHETNTFSRRQTDEQAFRERYYLPGPDAIAERGNQNTELAGFLDVGRRYGWHIDHVHSAAAGPSGKVTRAAFDWLTDPIIAKTTTQHYDGILLGLHGAMVTDFCDDGEGELLRRLRTSIGNEIPIAITLDLHANVSQLMCELANIIVSYKTYPHIDMRKIANQAGTILHRSLTGEINPRTIHAGCPMLEEVNGARTDVGPMIEWLQDAREWEQRRDVFAVSINGGFASADTLETGPSIVVTAEGDLDVHQAFANTLAGDMWNRRHDVLNNYLDVETAAKRALDFDASSGPLVIADYADNPGAGAYGDATNLLRALLEAGVSDACFGPLVDAESVQLLQQCETGSQVQIRLGGKTDPDFGGGPIELSVELLSISDGHYIGAGAMIGGLRGNFGPSAVIRSAGIEILVTTIAQQILDLQQFRCFGIEPAQKRVIALKSMQHFRADFEPVAGQVIVCDSGALCTPRYERMPYEKVKRPVFPLDTDFE